jgi:hypothetical protein
VRIRYDYVFEPAPPPPAPQTEPSAAADSASSAGADAAPAAGAAPTAAAGSAPPAVSAPAAAPPSAPLDEYEATAAVEAPPREVTRHTVDPETISRVPGTRGDVLRAIEIMPGVARTSLADGTPILRGAAGNESQTFFNGTPVPFLYHFGGLTSFLSPRLVDKLEFYPGNFSVRYGRVAGGAIEVRARDPESRRLRAALDLNLIDSALYVETPLGERSGIAIAARRSNIDFIFDKFVPKDAYSVVAAPVYYDYQLIGFHKLSETTRVRVLGYGARDALKFFFAHPPDTDPTLSGNVNATIAYHRLGLELESHPNQGPSGSLSATFGRTDQQAHFGPLTQTFGGYELHGRAETGVELTRTLRFSAGAELFSWFIAGEYRGPAPGQTEGDPTQNSPLATQHVVTAHDDHIRVVRPAAYVELGYQPVQGLLLLPGARLDYFGDIQQAEIDPRLAARYEVVAGTTLKAGVGRFTQAPEWWQGVRGVGNPEIDPYRALHTSAGI